MAVATEERQSESNTRDDDVANQEHDDSVVNGAAADVMDDDQKTAFRDDVSSGQLMGDKFALVVVECLTSSKSETRAGKVHGTSCVCTFDGALGSRKNPHYGLPGLPFVRGKDRIERYRKEVYAACCGKEFVRRESSRE